MSARHPLTLSALCLALLQAGISLASPLTDLVTNQPAGTWAKVNQNKFKEAWVPTGKGPNGDPGTKINAWNSGGYDPVNGDFYVLGGDNDPYYGNEVYRWSGQTLRWQRDSLPSAIRQARDANGNVVIISGSDTHYVTAGGVDDAPMSSETYENVVFLPISRRLA